MKKHYYIVPSAALLGTLAVFQWSKHQQTSAMNGASTALTQQSSTRLSNVDRLVEQSLAAKGQLWETVEANGRERMSKSMPVDAKCFTAATTSDVGTDLTIEFSKQIPSLQATVSGRKTETDGTVITHLRVAGAPEGQLTI